MAQRDSAAAGIGGNQADNTAGDSGAVYVFTRAGVVWTQQSYIKPSNTGASDGFGVVSLSADGDALAVGAPGESSNATGLDGDQSNNSLFNAGAAYLFTRSAGVWTQRHYVKATNPGIPDQFGAALAISGDGSALFVGAFSEASNATGIGGNQANNSSAGAGALYIYQ